MRTFHTTLGYLIDGERVLLAAKKRDFGEGKWNGFGGKQEEEETIEETLVREAQEEICVTPKKWEKVALLEFDEYYKNERVTEMVHVYLISTWDGEPSETEEMRPAWFNMNNLPYNNMFPDDIYWHPKVLAGKKMKGFFHYDQQFNILDFWVEETETVE